MITINMRSTAMKVQAQGVGSVYNDQVRLVKEKLGGKYKVTENARGKFDIIHFHTVNLNYYFERLLTKRRSVSVGYVHLLPDTVDGSIKLPWLFTKAFYRYLLAFYNSMDYLVTVNPQIIDKIRKYGIKKPKVCYIPNFVSERDFYEKSNIEKTIIREEYGFSEDDFVVLCVGQTQTRKGIFDFIETAKKSPEIKFVWAGGFSFGKITDGYEKIRKIMAKPPENVTFLGLIDRNDMVNVYNIADVFFLPSYDELFPMTILEAVACRLPVVLRDIDAYKNILSGGYLSGNTPDDFSAALTELKNDRGEYDYWRDRAWECHKRYDEDAISGQWDRFYNAAFNKSANPQRIISDEIVNIS